ncbi:protein of unknown function [Chitinophaga costaii]|uniref:DUF5004 domain-containing protein n=1 Tax=Chitinophaga costaii TaxID=1335309 RepID=A0A1C4AVU4_9BACT|nr:DUF5004 domain-containing protein [Chitinophaga costaii]PUZ26766.1 DUF5004 domain-containing protein [Chitinophaga costaii]SCB98732.1 protein of unknown function [Chitinophaga costaii]
MTTKNLFHRAGHLCIVLLLMLAGSCKQSEVVVAEAQKDISGDWRISKAVRNGIDITTLADFSQFRIHFTADNKYSLENPLPFVVSKDGSYSLDDPAYPFRLTFTPTGDSAVSTTFNYPVVNGARTIVFSFSPGCSSNTYLYTLQRVQP